MKDQSYLDILNDGLEIAARCEVDSWIDLKKILLLSLPPESRKHFSTRDSLTKKHSINDFEQNVIDIYYRKTGARLRLPHEE